MRVLILGADGYLGWPTAMYLSKVGHDVCGVDNYLRQKICEETNSPMLFPHKSLGEKAKIFETITGTSIDTRELDLTIYENMLSLVKEFRPDCIVHYAEQPSAPYSMTDFKSAQLTFQNNLNVTFNCIWSVIEVDPSIHIVKLGTMGEYGTPNIDIEEGWLDISHNGRSDTFLYPRAAGSLYHTTKVLDTDLLWFYVRSYGLAVTDLMQGPVYGINTAETKLDDALLPSFNYDDIFGTVFNRFIVQAVVGVPLTVYGQGGQTRGYLNINDTLQCVRLAAENPAKTGKLRIMNQFTETFSVNKIASLVQVAASEIGIEVTVQNIPNPRKEKEEHFYNPKHSSLTALGLKPTLISNEIIIDIMQTVSNYKELIDHSIINPRIKWS